MRRRRKKNKSLRLPILSFALVCTIAPLYGWWSKSDTSVYGDWPVSPNGYLVNISANPPIPKTIDMLENDFATREQKNIENPTPPLMNAERTSETTTNIQSDSTITNAERTQPLNNPNTQQQLTKTGDRNTLRLPDENTTPKTSDDQKSPAKKSEFHSSYENPYLTTD